VPQDLIDIPIETLPPVDEHSIAVDASPEEIWAALLAVLDRGFTTRPAARALARSLGCVPAESSGEPGEIGSTVPGFIVTRAVRPAVLALMGEHRYSRYALVFTITERPEATPLLAGETRAEFPGRKGRTYRALVIGTRGHVLVTTSLLRSIRRRAERAGD
jgi:hypothetical protein